MLPHQPTIRVSPGSERAFGCLLASVLLAVGLWPVLRGAAPILPALAGAVLLLVLALIYPQTLRTANRLWMQFGLLMGRVISPLVLLIVFIATIVPIGLILKALGKDRLGLKIDRQKSSYWIDRVEPPNSMKKQF